MRHRLAGGGLVLLDGGLATTLAAAGHDLSDALWSARLLLDDPAAIVAAHAAFLEAGAEVVTTASYQLAAESLAATGRDPTLASGLFERSVEVAVRAADAHTVPGRPRPLVAASIGPYGGVLADGSEYRGGYGLSVEELVAFHAPRVEALLTADPDVLACETIPAAGEVAALARILAGTGATAWMSVTVDSTGTRTAEGQPLDRALAPALELDEVVAVGVNCCAPRLVPDALAVLSLCGRPLVAYPNAGDRWDAGRRTWVPRARDERPDPGSWVAAGARLVGGCCGTAPAELERLAAALR